LQIQWDENSFHVIRSRGLDELKDSVNSREEEMISTPSLIIVDDNMYLRSMRREVYRIVRDASNPAALCVIWINTPITIAWERNEKRQEREELTININLQQFIPKESFDRMVQSFEPPHPQHICDRTYLIVTENEQENACAGCDESTMIMIQSTVEKLIYDLQQKERMRKNMNEESHSVVNSSQAVNFTKRCDEFVRKVTLT
jgi:tRNA uridine 5-carbamoylmethylation protein Kti12